MQQVIHILKTSLNNLVDYALFRYTDRPQKSEVEKTKKFLTGAPTLVVTFITSCASIPPSIEQTGKKVAQVVGISNKFIFISFNSEISFILMKDFDNSLKLASSDPRVGSRPFEDLHKTNHNIDTTAALHLPKILK